jgi:AraC-like DNA-binding protein
MFGVTWHTRPKVFVRPMALHTGKTFPEFRNELRIGRACRMLSEGHATITEIAFACGFANLSNFNRQFLRLKGVSPREFRKQIRSRVSESNA